jgi:hypothetical protein
MQHTALYYGFLLCLVWPLRLLVMLFPVVVVLPFLLQVLPVAWSQPFEHPFSLLVAHREYFALYVYSIVETLFTVNYLWTKRRLQTLREPPPIPSRLRLFEKCLAEISDMDSFISKWFFAHDPQLIGKADIREWLAWAFFSKHEHELSKQDDEELAKFLERVNEVDTSQDRLDGRGGGVNIRNTLDPVRCQARPLLYYLVCLPQFSIVGVQESEAY